MGNRSPALPAGVEVLNERVRFVERIAERDPQAVKKSAQALATSLRKLGYKGRDHPLTCSPAEG